MDFVAIDFETANPNHNSACAIGITPVKNGVVGDTFYSLIRPPELEFTYHNIQVHGITANDVIDSPTLDQLWPVISSHIMGNLVVAHHVSSDISILRQSLQAVGIPIPRINYLCSQMLSESLWPYLKNHHLDTLCDVHSISLEHHHAGSDAHAAAQLILLGGRKKGVTCPRELATSCSVSLGELVSYVEWTTCQKISAKPATNPKPADRDKGQELVLVDEDTSRVRKSRSKSNLPQVCFSGFSESVKETLSLIADEHSFVTVSVVTVNLAILVTGPGGAGPTKLKKAQAQGCQILTEAEFRSLLDSSSTE